MAQDNKNGISTVKLTSFTVLEKNKKIAIDWSTEKNTATNYFEIQKSTDGMNFKTIALVLGPDPQKRDCDCYGCFDKFLKKDARHSYYRLKHIDQSGKEELSEVKMIAKL